LPSWLLQVASHSGTRFITSNRDLPHMDLRLPSSPELPYCALIGSQPCLRHNGILPLFPLTLQGAAPASGHGFGPQD